MSPTPIRIWENKWLNGREKFEGLVEISCMNNDGCQEVLLEDCHIRQICQESLLVEIQSLFFDWNQTTSNGWCLTGHCSKCPRHRPLSLGSSRSDIKCDLPGTVSTKGGHEADVCSCWQALPVRTILFLARAEI